MTDPVARLNAALEGRYAIERELGEGGMATVYLAEDLRHERKVALKVLKPELAAVVGAERFLAEIKTTANLQHPHILPLFDSGEAESFLYYVMPYVEEVSLRQRLDREHQLPVDEAVHIATAVAHALDYAHRHGVIHRDIKPANILLQDGEAVVADFGIALAVSAAGGHRLTETGLSVGTPHYMSPEQATGDLNVGPATDIYALGCVLHEMLIGEPPYTGKTPQAILAKILTGEPESVWAQRKSVPANVDGAVRKALEKLPADRFGDAGDFAKALGDPAFRLVGPSGPTDDGTSRWKRVSLLASSLAVVLLVTTVWSLSRPAPSPPVARFIVALPQDQEIALNIRSRLALAPDGSFFVYVGPAPDGQQQLWLRPLEDLNATPIPGTEGGYNPFFSPDGSRLGFMVGNTTLRLVPVQGGLPVGLPVTVVDSVVGSGGTTWGRDGYLYADGIGAVSLFKVPVGGGVPEAASTLDTGRGETNHLWPEALPNGRGILFTVDYGGDEPQDVAVLDLATGTHHVLTRGAYARYALTGHILYVTANGTMMVAPFDEDALGLTGDPLAVVEGLDVRLGDATDLTISNTGTLMYTTRTRPSDITELVWVTRDGSATLIQQSRGTFKSPALSPNGTQVAVEIDVLGDSEVWIKRLPDGTLSQFTLLGGSDPAWSPDGLSIAFMSRRIAYQDLFVRPADGASEATMLQDGAGAMWEVSYSPDGSWIVYWENGTIYVAQVGADIADRVTLAADVGDQRSVAISPNGRWVAYTSGQSGTNEVYVASFPDASTTRWLVAEGTYPAWARSGNELFYRSASGALVATQVSSDPSFAVDRQEELFSMDDYVGSYDVDLDDQRFVMVRSLQDVEATPSLVIWQNFFEVLKSLVPN